MPKTFRTLNSLTLPLDATNGKTVFTKLICAKTISGLDKICPTRNETNILAGCGPRLLIVLWLSLQVGRVRSVHIFIATVVTLNIGPRHDWSVHKILLNSIVAFWLNIVLHSSSVSFGDKLWITNMFYQLLCTTSGVGPQWIVRVHSTTPMRINYWSLFWLAPTCFINYDRVKQEHFQFEPKWHCPGILIHCSYYTNEFVT